MPLEIYLFDYFLKRFCKELNKIETQQSRFFQELLWFLLFIGWVPMLASYAFVLDPVATGKTGVLTTITDQITLYQQRGWGHPAIGILGLAGLVSAGLVIRLGRLSLWPIPAFLFWSSLIYQFNSTGAGGAFEMTTHVIYAALAAACTYLFLRHGHLLSTSFIGFTTILFLDVAGSQIAQLFGAAPGASLLGMMFLGYQPKLVNALLFLTISVLVRMLWMMVRDNWQFVTTLSKSDLRSASRKTLRLWSPALAVFVFFGGFWWALVNLWVEPQMVADVERRTAELENRAIIWVIENEPMAQDSHVPYVKSWSRSYPSADPLERAINQWSDLYLISVHKRVSLNLKTVERDAKNDLARVPLAVKDQMNTAFPKEVLPLLEKPGWCFPLDPVCKTKEWIVEGANQMMVDARTGMIDGTTDFAGCITLASSDPNRPRNCPSDVALSDDVSDASTRVQSYYQQVYLATHTTTTSTVTGGFRTWRNVSLLLTLYSVIILLKTFLIVFSRVIFAPNGAASLHAQFLPDAPPSSASVLANHGQHYRIPITEKDAYFVARWGVTLEGPPPARRRPLGFRMPVARIASGTWAMNRIEGNRVEKPDEFDAELKVDEPAELVSWSLQPGERVIFRFSDFVGMSETLKMGRIASLGLSTLILGRMIYYYAEGPGTLILRTTAAARLTPSSEAEKPAPMPKLVAWGSSTRFSIFAALTTMDTFLSGYNLKTAPKDAVVWDSSTRRGDGPGTGIMRFMKSFLLPL
ncbi:hypothetical protein [Ruegeria sp. HU-ET01832]|uniref:hypothetical protein n=1 Tax=Ruegeria sp. HU-ET01832 TaxID=3135906 RepID=UPI0033423C6B